MGAPRRLTPDESFELEVLEEKAVALARVASRMEEALLALREWDQLFPQTGSLTTEMAERRSGLLADARDWAWCFVVQREAMGLREHQAALDAYAVPLEVRSRMAPRGPR